MPSIRNQSLSLRARTNLGKSESALAVATERLSSGLRINHAADDAAGESIASHFTAQIRGQHQAARNANDGISLAQTIEGALGEMGHSLQRIRELAVQAQNSTNSIGDLESIQAEIDQHLGEIERISHQTRFNSLDVLAQDADLSIQVGAHDGDTLTLNTRLVNTKTLNLDHIDVVHDPRLGSAVDRTVIDTQSEPAPIAPPPAVAPPPAIAPPTTTAVLSIRNGATVLTIFDAYLLSYQFNGTTQYLVQEVHGGLARNEYRIPTLPAPVGGVVDIDISVLPRLDRTTLSAAEAAAITRSGVPTLVGRTFPVPVAPPAVPAPTPTPPVVAPPPGPPPAADAVKKDTPIRLFDFLQSLAPVPAADDGRPLFDQHSKVHYLTDATGNANGEYVISGSDGNFYDISISSTGEVSFKPKHAPPTVNLKVVPMKRVTHALGQVDSLRGELGAMQHRLGSVITNLNHTADILGQARSRIEDADYAVETSNLTRQQILQQASKVALTQANQLAQNVLALLKED